MYPCEGGCLSLVPSTHHPLLQVLLLMAHLTPSPDGGPRTIGAASAWRDLGVI